MKNILGIGSAGSNIAKGLVEFKSYDVYYITTDDIKSTKKKLAVPNYENPEKYEDMDLSSIEKFLSHIKNNITVIVSGASIVSGLLLRILEPLKKKGVSIEIVYIMPEIDVLSGNKSLQENLVRNVVQEYARSGVFNRVLLVSNLALEELAGETTVMDYYDKLNQVFNSIYYMLDVFKNTKPVSSTFSRVKKSCRISTIGISSLELGEDKLLFPIKEYSEVLYYFGVNEEKLKTEKNLFRVITNKVKSKISEKNKVSFGIFPTNYEEDYIYTEYYSSIIQKKD